MHIYKYVYLLFFRFFSTIDYYKILTVAPRLYSGSLLFICIYICIVCVVC